MKSNLEKYINFAMGPSIRSWIANAYPDFESIENKQVEFPANLKDEFIEAILCDKKMEGVALSESKFSDIVEEFVSMDFLQQALKLVNDKRFEAFQLEFHANLALGIAGMISGNLDTAKTYLFDAHASNQKEPAPYSNLAQIFIAEGDFETAKAWLINGLKLDNNYKNFWPLLAECLQSQNPAGFIHEVRKIANETGSWIAYSFLASQKGSGISSFELMDIYGEIFHSGERDLNFLIEYTGNLGVNEEYEKITQAIWMWDSINENPNKENAWQLYANGINACIALGKHQEAKRLLEKIKFVADASPEIQHIVKQLESEISQKSN